MRYIPPRKQGRLQKFEGFSVEKVLREQEPAGSPQESLIITEHRR
jgi:hypothetical protein